MKNRTFQERKEGRRGFKKAENSDMQNSYYGKSVDRVSTLVGSQKGSPIPHGLDDEEFSNNVLNIGFIAEDSKMHLSDSASVYSDGFSISAVSAIQPNPKDPALFVSHHYDEFGTISGMEEWPSPENPFSKKNFKRTKPQVIEDELDELADRCTKKKMSERNKILTISPGRKVGGGQQKSYMLRSRSKLIEEDSSSNDDIREMLRDIEKYEKGANGAKSKPSSK